MPNFEGHELRECTEHRTVGPHRAWCFDCNEWCYPEDGCKGCRIPALEAAVQHSESSLADALRASLVAAAARREAVSR